MELADTDTASSSSSDTSSSSSSKNSPAPEFSVLARTGALVPETFSMTKVARIMNSMSDLDNNTMFKFVDKLIEKPEWTQAFIALKPERRRAWIEYLTSLP